MPPAGALGSGMGEDLPGLAPLPGPPSSGPSAEQTVRFGSSGGRSSPLDPPSAGPLFRLAGRRRRDGASPRPPCAQPRPARRPWRTIHPTRLFDPTLPRSRTRHVKFLGAGGVTLPLSPIGLTRSGSGSHWSTCSDNPCKCSSGSRPRRCAAPPVPRGPGAKGLGLAGAKSANSADFAPAKETAELGSSRAHRWPQKPRRQGTLGARRPRLPRPGHPASRDPATRRPPPRDSRDPAAPRLRPPAARHPRLPRPGHPAPSLRGPPPCGPAAARPPAAQIARGGRGHGDSGVRAGARRLGNP